MLAATTAPCSVGDFLRAGPERLRDWVLQRPLRLIAFCVAVMGSWREPLQAVYTGIKLPLVILLTALGNGLLNGILAPLLGLNISFRQSLMMVLVGLALTSVVLGSFSPIALFVVWNTPLPTSY